MQDSPGENPQVLMPVTCGPLCGPTCAFDTQFFLNTFALWAVLSLAACLATWDLCLCVRQVLGLALHGASHSSAIFQLICFGFLEPVPWARQGRGHPCPYQWETVAEHPRIGLTGAQGSLTNAFISLYPQTCPMYHPVAQSLRSLL